jgi:hypothetical protein
VKGTFEDFDVKVVTARNFEEYWVSSCAQAYAARRGVINSDPLHNKVGFFGGRLECLGLEHKLASRFCFVFLLQFFCKSIVFGSHELAKGCLYLAHLFISIAINIFYLKSKFLLLFEKIIERNSCRELWIQAVFDNFSFSLFHPHTLSASRFFGYPLIYDALRIGFGKNIQIFKFFGRYLDFNWVIHSVC